MGIRFAQLADIPVVRVPIKALADADSPRLAGVDESHARFLAELMTTLPPIVVHQETMRVIDGMHRLRAAVLRGDAEIEVKFFDGAERDAFVLAVEANARHGMPLTMPDRLAAAERIMKSHPEWSDRVISSTSGVAAKVVAALRRRASGDVPQLRARIGKDGRVRPVDCSHGRKLAGELLRENPQASLREIVRAAKISLGTARDVRERVKRGEDPVLPSQRKSPAAGDALEVAAGDDSDRMARDGVSALRGLRSDPSLRFSEDGRFLLRLLEVCAIEGSTWDRLVENVPAHCLPTVAETAEVCADMWQRFAEQLKQYRLESA